ncbi:sensory rhodopsin transducer [Paenibacillus filicis]|uniref:Sensory rhodopsin transducer n=1 Tax=Paenibacillus gyeongsangnamensis TaxID=3388067 RepID=A0ABT4Q564_9BACL|nr:sensory rhodopsin transducer [Paenibacillus filicis]MCZ8511963.1 sensory rhodopsin transducer [Paenibacillus filicis]
MNREAAPKGHSLWFIPDGYIPPESSGSLESHESVCVLNCNKEDVTVAITVFFEDRPPIERIEVVVEGRRTKHIRTAGLQKDGESIPKGVPYAMEVEASLPIIVQYSRLDATQPANALMSVIAFPS